MRGNVEKRYIKMKPTIFGIITSVQAGIDVSKTAASHSNGHVIHRIEGPSSPDHRKKKLPVPTQDWFEEEVSVYDLVVTYVQFMKNRPILLYPKIICSGCLVVIGMTIANTLSQPGAIRDLLRYSSGRFSEFYTAIGVWLVLKVVYYFVKFLWAKVVSNDHFFRKSGSWAVITGCTSGLGREYALQLAAKGLNVVLISRSQASLTKLAEEISNKYTVSVLTHAADFVSESDDLFDDINAKFKDLEIGVLVNNVGVSDDPQLFHQESQEQISNIIKVNMTALAEMSRIVLPGMVERGRGIVINLASALGTTPAPLLSTYGASKRCADILTRALDVEYRDRGIFVQSVTPYFISTNMTKNVDTGPLIPDAEKFVRNQLSTVGRDHVTHGFMPHALQGWFIKQLPDSMLRRLFYHLKSRSEGISITKNGVMNGKH